MGPANEVHVMFVEELCDHVSTKREGDATVVLTPAEHIFIWVGPQQVAQQALVGHISGPHDPADLLHRLEVWRQPWRQTFDMNSCIWANSQMFPIEGNLHKLVLNQTGMLNQFGFICTASVIITTVSHRNQNLILWHPAAKTHSTSDVGHSNHTAHHLCYMVILCNWVFTLIINMCLHILCSRSHRHVFAVAGWWCHVARALG